jgi:ADP-ribosylation factor family
LLLGPADAVIFVTDGSAESISHTKQMWAELVTLFDGQVLESIPVVIQVNKQDLESRLSEEDLRRELNCPAAIPIVRAEAARGVGVRESLVLAVRAAAYGVRRALSSGGLEALTGSAEGPDQIRAMIEAEEQAAPLAPVELLRGRNQLWTQRPNRSEAAPERQTIELSDPLKLQEEACPELPAPSVPPGMVWPANIWSVAPWLTTVRSLLAFARARSDAAELGRVLCGYADAVFDASFALSERCQLDLDPDHFGWLNGQYFYLRDRGCENARASNPVSALSDCCRDLLEFSGRDRAVSGSCTDKGLSTSFAPTTRGVGTWIGSVPGGLRHSPYVFPAVQRRIASMRLYFPAARVISAILVGATGFEPVTSTV